MKLTKKYISLKKGFTLIELLVVIAIIAALGGVSYGPIIKQIDKAHITNTVKICKDLTFAITSFEQEYDSLPYVGSYPGTDTTYYTDDGKFLAVLMGKESVSPTINDKGKEFFTAQQAKGDKDGIFYDVNKIPTKLLDKWGNHYSIILDHDGDGVIKSAKMKTDFKPRAGVTGATSGVSYDTDLNTDNALAATPGKDGIFNDTGDAKSW